MIRMEFQGKSMWIVRV